MISAACCLSKFSSIIAMNTRRHFIRHLAFGTGLLAAPGAFADALRQTTKVGYGPFYPDHLPLDTDNDLLVINDALTSAIGEVAYVSGRVLGPDGEPVRNAVVEIWQADSTGTYIHSKSRGDKAGADKNFQGYGRFITGSSGEYLFRTIKPVGYSGRCPHIHYAVKTPGHDNFTTECHIKGHPLNDKDMVRSRLKDDAERDAISVDYTPLPGAKAGELAAKFDIVLGFTPKA